MLPFYMIIVSERIKDYETGIKMYLKIFNAKYLHINQWYLNNLVFNLQFFINKITENKSEFIQQFINYKNYLTTNCNFTFDDKFTNFADYQCGQF